MTTKRLLMPALGLLVLGSSVSVSGCATTCSASADKLAALRRGMTYDETVQVMRCPGTVVTARGPSTADYAIVEWNGPDSPFFTRTRLDFLDGKLLSYTTERRGAL
ncbi:MAG: hypothetical protein J0J01_26180 [Reyranella sp.]|uniref:hypothetical protein n=1 Tax=Reyranella sp. TaxID=1929291 RepID=UPI001AC6B7AF|nr:hypothetical protein [Reyranella sp.]MBN9090416.1 hypothetical protein [Reyranella sp.]